MALSRGPAKRRYSLLADQCRRAPGRLSLGPGEGRSRRQPVQGVRRGGRDAAAGTAAYQLGGRQHAQNRDRRRDADAPAAFWPGARTHWRAELARLLGGQLADARRRSAWWCRPAARTAIGNVESRDHQPAPRLHPQERGPVQRKYGSDRVPEPAHWPRGRQLPSRDGDGRGSSVSDAAVRSQLSVQEASRRSRLGSDSLFSAITGLRGRRPRDRPMALPLLPLPLIPAADLAANLTA